MAAIASSSRSFRRGDAVSVHGLVSGEGSWHNGATGTVVEEYSAEKDDGRLTVSFCCGDPSRFPAKLMRLKRGNLRPVPAPMRWVAEEVCFGNDLAKSLPSRPLRERFQEAGRAFARARPWEHRHSAKLPVCLRLLRGRRQRGGGGAAAGKGSGGGGGGGGGEDAVEVVRSVVVSLVGKSGNAFGAAMFASYARFVSFRRAPGAAGGFDGSMPLFLKLGSWGEAQEDLCSGRALGQNPSLSSGIWGCHRDPKGVDAAELMLALAVFEKLPLFWEALTTSQPPRDAGVATPLGYSSLSVRYPMGDGVAALGRIIDAFDPPPPARPSAGDSDSATAEAAPATPPNAPNAPAAAPSGGSNTKKTGKK